MLSSRKPKEFKSIPVGYAEEGTIMAEGSTASNEPPFSEEENGKWIKGLLVKFSKRDNSYLYRNYLDTRTEKRRCIQWLREFRKIFDAYEHLFAQMKEEYHWKLLNELYYLHVEKNARKMAIIKHGTEQELKKQRYYELNPRR